MVRSVSLGRSRRCTLLRVCVCAHRDEVTSAWSCVVRTCRVLGIHAAPVYRNGDAPRPRNQRVQSRRARLNALDAIHQVWASLSSAYTPSAYVDKIGKERSKITMLGVMQWHRQPLNNGVPDAFDVPDGAGGPGENPPARRHTVQDEISGAYGETILSAFSAANMSEVEHKRGRVAPRGLAQARPSAIGRPNALSLSLTPDSILHCSDSL